MKNPMISAILVGFSLMAFSQENNHPDSQLATLNNQITKTPNDPSLYLAKANIYNKRNDFAHSNQNYNKVLRVYQAHPDPQFSNAYAEACYSLADDHFFRNSEDEQALHYVRLGLNVKPESKNLVILEAIILSKDKEQRETAKEKFAALSVKYPDDEKLLLHYAWFLQDFDPLGAAEQYQKVVAIDPANKDALVSLGTIYNNEAYRLIEANADLTEAYKLAQHAALYLGKAHELAPEDQELTNIFEQLNEEVGKPEPEEVAGEKEGSASEKEKVPF